MERIGDLSTEQPAGQSLGFDGMSALEQAALMNRMDAAAAGAVAGALPEIARAVELIAGRMARGGRLFYLGAGTSGRLGVLDASECPPTFGVPEDAVQGVIAGGDRALRHAVEGAEDDPGAARGDLAARGFGRGDALVAVSASGRTPYCLGALAYARELGAAAISLCCNRGARMSAAADVAIEADTGSEALAGSTRLKAGTAQKMVLNMLSTCAMARLGKVYNNEMVDMRPTNGKLRERAVCIVMRAAGADRARAEEALADADYDVKAAIVAVLAGAAAGDARRALACAGGFVRGAVEQLKREKG